MLRFWCRTCRCDRAAVLDVAHDDVAVTGLADRFAASRIFTVCALLGALCNAAFALLALAIIVKTSNSTAVIRILAGMNPKPTFMMASMEGLS